MSRNRPFWLSIQPISKSIFSRRNGYKGYRLFGYSVCLRLFGIELLTERKPTDPARKICGFIGKKIIYGCDGRGDGQLPYLTRYTLIDRLNWQLCLHVFHRSDYPDFHDHPWDFWTFILWRGYWENTADGKRTCIMPLRLLFRPATHTHWVELRNDQDGTGDKPAVTLVLMGSKVREWGFRLNGQWLHWQAYFRAKNC